MTISLADVLTITGALIFFAFGLAYFYKSRSAKNHCSTVQENIEGLNENNRMMMFALMRGAGGGAIAVSVIITWLQLEYANNVGTGIPLSIVIVSGLFFLPAINGMMLVKRNTNLKPPVFVLALGMILILAGYFLNVSIG